MRMKAPLAEPADLADDEDGKVFIGDDAEPDPAAKEDLVAAEAVSAELSPRAEAVPDAPDTAVPEPEPETPPVLEIEPEAPPKADEPASPEAAAPVAETSAAPAAPDVLAAAQVEPATEPGEIPAWDRDPTLAELKPDIEALEMAMAEFADKEPAPVPRQEDDEPLPEVELKDPTMPSLPEITLDAAIEEKIREAEEALEKHDATIAEEDEAAIGAPERDTRADAELEKIAQGLARAKTIEDVDDRMAETLFLRERIGGTGGTHGGTRRGGRAGQCPLEARGRKQPCRTRERFRTGVPRGLR